MDLRSRKTRQFMFNIRVLSTIFIYFYLKLEFVIYMISKEISSICVTNSIIAKHVRQCGD